MKKIFFIILFFYIGISSSHANPDNIIFPDFYSKVSELEVDLKLFDFAVNQLKIFSEGPLIHLTSISSRAFTNRRIDCWVNVSSSIMKGPLAEKKKRLLDLCTALFLEYQKRFIMMDLDYQKKPDGVKESALRMTPSNLKIHIRSFRDPLKLLAEWESGKIIYHEEFLSD